MMILGLETSCDDTAAAVLVDGILQAHVVSTQLDHDSYGGIVPEVASRLHEQNIVPAVKTAIAKAGVSLGDLSAIAVTYGPGLAGSLVVGVSFAKGLSQALDIPLIGVDHMEGHLWAGFLDGPDGAADYPFLCLLVSGGHSHIWEVAGPGEYRLVGRSLDDAAGEAFDKGARLLGLGFPGGPAIQSEAQHGDPEAVSFPRPFRGTDHCNFSFSGLKTALQYYLRDLPPGELDRRRADIAASYQAAIIDCLLDRLQVAVQQTGLKSICIAGGVSANARLRDQLDTWADKSGLAMRYPPLEFCTDNAAMIALAGYHRHLVGETSGLDLGIFPDLSLAHHA